ncbi:hypothetical protein NQD34_005921 [Periophthalmus magnuspinnatus]|nr:hypothetical protein NQD34_005921 [Periophthalmus magnuspinnatus]
MWPYKVPGPGLDLNLNQILDQTLDMNRNKSMLQNLNARLSSYIHQVGRLESSNQELEHQIEVELRQRSPGDLKHLDSKLRIATDLQDQISVCIRECAFLKLQSLGAELSMFDLKSRCEEVAAEREQLGAEIRDLQLVWVEMQERHLTDLNQEVFQKEAELQGLQTQHQKDVQGLQLRRAGISVQLRSRTSNPDLALQLQDRSWSGLTLPPLDWSLQVPQVEACAPPEDSELLELKNTASGLQRELDLLRQETRSLESAAVDHMGALEQHLSVSQLRASSLCDELETTLDATEQQNQRNQNLQGRVKALRAELHRYQELLREANQDEELLIRTNQGGQLIMRTNPSRDQLPTANQRREHRVLSPGPIKSPSSPLKWPTPMTQIPSPKSQRSVQAGQSVQRKIGFEPDPRVAAAILSDSKHNTTLKTAAKNSPNEIQNVNINVNASERVSFGLNKEETKPNKSSAKSATEIKVTDAKTLQNLNLKTAQVETGVKLDKNVNVTSVHKMESKMERSDGGLAPVKSKEDANVSSTKTKTEVSQNRLQNTNINVNASEGVGFGLKKEVKEEKKEEAKPNMSSATSAAEMKVIESKTLQNLNLKTAQVETEAKLAKDINLTSVDKMERSDGGLASMKSKEDANVLANVSSTKTKTEVSQNKLQNANTNVNASEKVSFGLEKEVKGEKKEEAKPNMPSATSATEMKVIESKTLQNLNLNLKNAQVETGVKLDKDVNVTSVHKMESKMEGSDGGLAPVKSKEDANVQANVSRSKTETEIISQNRFQNANINVNASEGVGFGLKKEVKEEKKEEAKPNMSSAKSATEIKVIESKTLQNLNLKTAQVETGPKLGKDVNVTSVHKMESKMERSDGGLPPVKSKEDANTQANISSAKTETAEICGKVEIKSGVCAQNGSSVKLKDKMEDVKTGMILNAQILKGQNLKMEEKIPSENQDSISMTTEIRIPQMFQTLA